MTISGNKIVHCFCLSLSCLLFACRTDVVVYNAENIEIGDIMYNTSVSGFYLLNEGNMGSNKSSLDYYDFRTGYYSRNIFSERNPAVVKELGDVGNDLQQYGSRLYAVINCSNKVEVLTADSCRRIGQLDIPNCRYVAFSGAYGYVTSYAGPVEIGKQHAQIGFVAEFDTATLQITRRCNVGYQPDELAVSDGKLFVANSGGYMVPDYDSTVSVIDIGTMTELKRVTVAKNLHRVRLDGHGQVWVTSRGDYYDIPSRLFCLDPITMEVTDTLPYAVSEMWIDGDYLYFYGSEFSYVTMQETITYGIIDTRDHRLLTHSFLTDGTDKLIKKPYGLAVNPVTKDIYLTDAKDYVTPGMLYCFSPNGQKKWEVRTGDIPAHFAFLKTLKQ